MVWSWEEGETKGILFCTGSEYTPTKACIYMYGIPQDANLQRGILTDRSCPPCFFFFLFLFFFFTSYSVTVGRPYRLGLRRGGTESREHALCRGLLETVLALIVHTRASQEGSILHIHNRRQHSSWTGVFFRYFFLFLFFYMLCFYMLCFYFMHFFFDFCTFISPFAWPRGNANVGSRMYAVIGYGVHVFGPLYISQYI